jgi:hypothetical protein
MDAPDSSYFHTFESWVLRFPNVNLNVDPQQVAFAKASATEAGNAPTLLAF